MERKEAVGFVALTDVPGLGRVAVLQRRGEWNFEKDKPESFPGACQVTAHGKREDEDEDLVDTLVRESEEESGEAFASCIASAFDDECGKGDAVEVGRVETSEKLVITYAGVIPYIGVQTIHLHPGSGGLRFLTESQAGEIRDLTTYPKAEGVLRRDEIAMFPDEADAVRKAFAHFASQ